MYVFGVMISSVAITAFMLDTYPTASGEVSAMVNFARTRAFPFQSRRFGVITQNFVVTNAVGGFSVGYFQLDWGLKSGFDVSFGIQAAIVAVATILTAIVAIFGERLRKIGGPLHYASHQ
jgi:hypothetical protein